ncbi:MAG: hypothetical protein HYV07_17575 [Deltaproteobacteria bacterium]|nr:hypothetical protein [Deltaproteobacteria bacterium]
MKTFRLAPLAVAGALVVSGCGGSLECGSGTSEHEGFCVAEPTTGASVRPKVQTVTLERLQVKDATAPLLHPIHVSFDLKILGQTFDGYAVISLLNGGKGCVLAARPLHHTGSAEARTISIAADAIVQPSCESLMGSDAQIAITFDPFQTVELEGRALVDTTSLTDPIELVKLFRVTSASEVTVAVEASPGRDVEMTAFSLDRAAAVLEIPVGDRPGMTAAEVQALFPDDPPELHPDAIPAAVSPRSTFPNFSATAALRVFGLGAAEEIDEGDLELAYRIRPLPGGIGAESVPDVARGWLPLYSEIQSEGRAGEEPTVEELLTDYLDKLVGPFQSSKQSPLFVRKEAVAAMVVGGWREVAEFEVEGCLRPKFDEAPNSNGNNCASVPVVIIRKFRTPDDATGLARTSTQTAPGFSGPGIVELKRSTNALFSSGIIFPSATYTQVAGISSGLSMENVFGRLLRDNPDGAAYLGARFDLGLTVDLSPIGGPWTLPVVSAAVDQMEYRTDGGVFGGSDSYSIRKLLFSISLLPDFGVPIPTRDVGVQTTLAGPDLEEGIGAVVPVNPIYSPTLDFVVSLPIPGLTVEVPGLFEAGLYVTGTFGFDGAQAEMTKTLQSAGDANPCSSSAVSSRSASSTCVALIELPAPTNLAGASAECRARGGALATFRDLQVSNTPATTPSQAVSQLRAANLLRPNIFAFAPNSGAWIGHHWTFRNATCGLQEAFPAAAPGAWGDRRDFCSPGPTVANILWQGNSTTSIEGVGPKVQFPRPFPYSGLASTWPNLDTEINAQGLAVPANDSKLNRGVYCSIPSAGTSDTIEMTMLVRPRIALGLTLGVHVGVEADCWAADYGMLLNLLDAGYVERNKLRVSYFPSRTSVSGLLTSSTVADLRVLSGFLGGYINTSCFRLKTWGESWSGFQLYGSIINPDSNYFNVTTR